MNESETRINRLVSVSLDRKSTRLNLQSQAYLVCRLLLEKKKKMHTMTNLST